MSPTVDSPSSTPSLSIRSNRSMRMAGLACLVVLCMAIYVGFDVNHAIGQNKNRYNVAIPATRILSDLQYETQESRHATVHANANYDPISQKGYVAEFAKRSETVQALIGRLGKLRLPPELRQQVVAFQEQWNQYQAMSAVPDRKSDPGERDRQFQATTAAARAVHDSLDLYAKTSADAVRMAFVRSGFELVLLLLGTLHMIAVLATNGEKRKTVESLRVMNESLQTARAAAEESSKLKSEFLATVSHEIRTPMNGIIGMVDLLSRSGLNEEQKSYNENVRVSAETLLSILNDILDFSRIEAGNLLIDSTPFEPSEPAYQMADLLASASAQKDLEFVVRCSPNLPHAITGDAGRVRQILMNLAGNAVKFTHTGHVLVEVDAIETDATRCRIRYSVHDTGIGIPRHIIGTLFEQFRQADSSSTRRYGGTGLGLAISRKLVELMGGEIQVESQDGVGSTFSFELNVPVAEPVPAWHAPFSQTKPKVLIIEPSDVSARTVTEMLTRLGASPRCTLSAKEGVEILETSQAMWQAVFVSSRVQCVEPGLFVRIQRLLGKGRRLVVLAPRGRVDPKLVAREVRVVPKPLQMHTLEEALRLAISDRTPLPKREHAVMTRDLQELAKSVSRSAGSVAGESAKGLRVLVAEDNVVNQTIVRKLLEEAGCLVDVASNGRQAVSQWEDGEYDLLLMDCQMPELDGFEATREIRKRETAGERVPIIAITANVLDKDRVHCFAAGMDDFLSKPLRLDQLQDAVSRWTGQRRRPVATP